MEPVPFLIFLHEASINTFLDLALYFLSLTHVFSNSGFDFRSIWTSFLQERGGGKAPNTSS